MAEVKVFYDKAGNTLTVWFTDPALEHVVTVMTKPLCAGNFWTVFAVSITLSR